MTIDFFAHAERELWADAELTPARVARLFDPLLKGGADWADIYFQSILSRDWLLEDGAVRTGSFVIDRGAGMRTVTGERQTLAYANALDWASLMRCAETAGAMNAAGAAGAMPVPTRRDAPVVTPVDDALLAANEDGARQRALLETLDRLARGMDPRVTDVTATFQTETDVVMICGSDGRLVADVRPLTYLSVTVTVTENGRRERAGSGGGSRTGLDFFTPERLERWARQAVDEALHNLGASPAPAGVMPVVLGPGWPGILLHEAVGHGLEADFIRKGTSVFSKKLGERVASPGVTVVDDGTLPGRRGSLNVDDEGEPTRRTTLIEDGILTGFMHDLTSARLMRAAPTGNGRRESFATLPLPRMTNTFMAAGTTPPEEIIASVKRGVYASNFSGGQVDITNGKFVFSMSRAYLIENGRLTRPVRGATLIGDGATALRHIPLVGNDPALDEGSGQCGKDAQQVPVGVGIPTLRIDALTVGGTDTEG